ncbi:small acidic protein family-domain-containing protein [Hypoxylon crocopeplum]|nr:small acidic protein family-domain-containing protein [Hypoxylon crocopeplum]
MEASDPSPWKKLDPAKLRRDAEAKEAKLKRQQEQRLERAEARKEKRHAKSEAKQARKANVGRAAKWNDERKAADKLKKLANRPLKQEKRRRRLRLRAQKLEAQAVKLMAEAQRARARADFLDEQKEKENAEKTKLSREIEQMAVDPENEDYIPLDENTPAAPPIASESVDDEGVASSETKEAKEKKHKKKSEKRKRKAEEEEEAEAEAPDGATNTDAAGDAETPKDEKKKKKRKLEQATEQANSQEEAIQAEAPKEKKEKKEKKDKKKRKEKLQAEEYVPSTAAEGGATTNGGEQWNVSALEGSDKRKEKFLRLLGAKKTNGTSTTESHDGPTRSKSDIARVQHDLERQFDTGMRMKHEGQSHRKGLGA